MRKLRHIVFRGASVGRRPSAAATIATALAAVAAGVALLALGLTAPYGLPSVSYYELTAEFRDAANVKRFAEVRISGRRVGQVSGVSWRRGVARVHLQLEPDARPLRAGTRAHIRLKGLLGAKFVDLIPATRGRDLPQGATIPTSRTATTVDLFEVLQALDGRRRARLRATLRGLGQGFAGRGGDLNAALGDAPPTLRDITAVAEAVNARGAAARRLVGATQSATAAYDPVREDLAGGFEPLARALRPFADRRGAVQGTLEAAAPALEAVRSGLAASDPLLRQTERLARATRRLADAAPAALRQTVALLREGRRPVARTRPLLARVGAAVPPTVELTDRLDPVIAPARRYFQTGLPALREVGQRRCDLLAHARNWRSMFAFGLPSKHEIGPQTGWRLTLVSSGKGEEVAGTPDKIPARTRYRDWSACVEPEPLR